MIRGWFLGWMASAALWTVLLLMGIWTLVGPITSFGFGLLLSTGLSLLGMRWGARRWRQ